MEMPEHLEQLQLQAEWLKNTTQSLGEANTNFPEYIPIFRSYSETIRAIVEVERLLRDQNAKTPNPLLDSEYGTAGGTFKSALSLRAVICPGCGNTMWWDFAPHSDNDVCDVCQRAADGAAAKERE